eukprot:CAMPEP_0184085490 /NCGR_PEP_ID=MMETSP0974-20121125/4734_1 /TAXON_ID=483370 /ORGANISM="non described non described, Strain CCMP2097" /LENGTH=140 /DNA_ID=CAMNT_0026388169 /DNA_START=69 /DNA_END=491 /DNA_ORIENTATION=-
MAVCVGGAEVEERLREALRRGEAPPPRGFLVRLGHALALVEHEAEISLGVRIALLFLVRLRHPLAAAEHRAEIVLSSRMPLLDRASVPLRAGLVVDVDAVPGVITQPQCTLSFCVPLRRGELVQLERPLLICLRPMPPSL